jgi:YD repeat-containing protein
LGHVTTYSYDALERLLTITDPLGRIISVTYDGANRLARRIDPLVATSFSYDAAGEVIRVTYSDGTPAVSLSYDSLGRRIRMSDGTGTSIFQWDALSRLVGSTDGAGNHVAYGYDLAGRTLTIGYPSAGTVTRTYDTVGRLASVSDFLGATTRFAYDADSRLMQRSYPNGNVRHLSYDHDSRLIAINEPIFGEAYTRDPLGLVRSQTGSGGDQNQYSYTALSQIASDKDQAFAYDAALELSKLGGIDFSYDAAGELTSATRAGLGPVVFSYDARGERLSGSVGFPVSYAYDGVGRLKSFSGIANYTYTGDGLRTSKTAFGRNQHFVWDRTHPLAEILDDGINRYIYGVGKLPIEQVGLDGRRAFLLRPARQHQGLKRYQR